GSALAEEHDPADGGEPSDDTRTGCVLGAAWTRRPRRRSRAGGRGYAPLSHPDNRAPRAPIAQLDAGRQREGDGRGPADPTPGNNVPRQGSRSDRRHHGFRDVEPEHPHGSHVLAAKSATLRRRFVVSSRSIVVRSSAWPRSTRARAKTGRAEQRLPLPSAPRKLRPSHALAK